MFNGRIMLHDRDSISCRTKVYMNGSPHPQSPSKGSAVSSLTRREVVGLVSAVVVAAVAGLPAAGAEEKPLTPATIVEKKFEGQATVEFLVGEVGLMLTSRATSTEESEPLLITPKAEGKKTGQVYLLVSWETATRLKQLGIENPAEHFRGKVVRVSGTVERLTGSTGPEYRIQVTNLNQFEVIRKP
jgi:hypothetical protein